jgi:hypothetical protein
VMRREAGMIPRTGKIRVLRIKKNEQMLGGRD